MHMIDMKKLSDNAEGIVSEAIGTSSVITRPFSVESKAQVVFPYLSYLTQLSTMKTIQDGNAAQFSQQSETLKRMDAQIEEMKRQGRYTRLLAVATSILALSTIIVPIVVNYLL